MSKIKLPVLPCRVVVESPFAGDVERNKRYLAQCLRDSMLNHEEAPFASHGLYPMALDDTDPQERELGIHLGFAYQDIAERVVIYQDFGISDGMKKGIENAKRLDIPVIFRNLPKYMLERV